MQRLCAARELVRQAGVDEELTVRPMAPSMAMSAEAALVKQLSTVGDPLTRKAYIKMALDKSQTKERRYAQDKRDGANREGGSAQRGPFAVQMGLITEPRDSPNEPQASLPGGYRPSIWALLSNPSIETFVLSSHANGAKGSKGPLW